MSSTLLTYLAVDVDLTRVERPTSGLELFVDGVSLLDDFKSVLAGISFAFAVVAGDDSFGLRKALTPGGGSLMVNCCLGTGRSFGVSKVIFSFTGDFSGAFGILLGAEGLLSNILILSDTGVETMLEMRDMVVTGLGGVSTRMTFSFGSLTGNTSTVPESTTPEHTRQIDKSDIYSSQSVIQSAAFLR